MCAAAGGQSDHNVGGVGLGDLSDRSAPALWKCLQHAIMSSEWFPQLCTAPSSTHGGLACADGPSMTHLSNVGRVQNSKDF